MDIRSLIHHLIRIQGEIYNLRWCATNTLTPSKWYKIFVTSIRISNQAD